MVNIKAGLEVLEKYGYFRNAFREKHVYTDILCEEVSLSDMNKLLEFGWTGIDDYIGYELNYSEEFEEYFSKKSMWSEFMDAAFGEPNCQIKGMAWDVWQQAQKSISSVPPSPAYKKCASHWCE